MEPEHQHPEDVFSDCEACWAEEEQNTDEDSA